MKKVAGRLRLDLAQYREMAAFAQFGSELDAATQAQLARGARMVEALKQDQYQPLSVEKQIVTIFAGTKGFFDPIPVKKLREFENGLLEFIETNYNEIYRGIKEHKEITPEIESKLRESVDEFTKKFNASPEE
jgi:F-type H+-transporting ATPase subunit alpha